MRAGRAGGTKARFLRTSGHPEHRHGEGEEDTTMMVARMPIAREIHVASQPLLRRNYVRTRPTMLASRKFRMYRPGPTTSGELAVETAAEPGTIVAGGAMAGPVTMVDPQ